MPITADSIFLYTYFLCVGLIVFAVPLYGWIRKNSPQLGWNRHGNVSTAQFNHADLLGIALFLFIFGWLLTLAQAPPDMEADGITPKEVKVTPAIMLVGMIAQQVVMILIVMVLLMYRSVNFVELFGLRWKKAKLLFVIAPVGVILAVAFSIALRIAGFDDWLNQTFGDESKLQETVRVYQGSQVTFRILIAVAVAILAPVAEEIVFRGYIYGATKRFTDRFFAAIFSSLLFAVVHNNIDALLPLFFLALILALAYELTGSLWAPISIHALFNATTFVNLEVNSIPG